MQSTHHQYYLQTASNMQFLHDCVAYEHIFNSLDRFSKLSALALNMLAVIENSMLICVPFLKSLF